MKYGAIDLHANNSVVVVSDEADRALVQRRVGNRLEEVLAVLQPHREELAGVVVEATYNWYWLVDGLQAAGYAVRLAHTAALPQYAGLKHGDDHSDARHLAQLLRLGLVPPAYVYPKAQRAARDLARQRMKLVQSRTAEILAIENLLARETGVQCNGNQVKRLQAEDVAALGLHPDTQLGVDAHRAVLGALDAQIAALERRLQERVRLQPGYQWLRTVPGIGQVLATVIMLESGPIERFGQVGQYASYARCVDSVHLSNGKKKGAGNVKSGNRYLAWAFVEAAHYACRYCPQAQRFYERKRAKANTALATKALAHKLARACYHMLRQGQPFDLARCFS
jgi:transposase